MVGGPLSHKCVLFLVPWESSIFKTIVLTWLTSGVFRQTLTMCSAECQEVSGEGMAVVQGGIACLLQMRAAAVFWGPPPRLCSQILPLSPCYLSAYCPCTHDCGSGKGRSKEGWRGREGERRGGGT